MADAPVLPPTATAASTPIRYLEQALPGPSKSSGDRSTDTIRAQRAAQAELPRAGVPEALRRAPARGAPPEDRAPRGGVQARDHHDGKAQAQPRPGARASEEDLIRALEEIYVKYRLAEEGRDFRVRQQRAEAEMTPRVVCSEALV